MSAAGDGTLLQGKLDFFKQDKGFDRLLTGMSAMYARHGRTYGAVRLANPTPEEERAISAFFERDYFDQALIRISLGDFGRQLDKVFSSSIKFASLMAEYSQEHDILDPDMHNIMHKKKDAFTENIAKNLLPKYKNTLAASWLNDVIINMRRTYKPWVEQHVTEPDKVVDIIDKVAEMLNNLPVASPPMQLSAFAAQFMNSPYALDFNGEYGALFVRALAHHFNTPVPCSIESSIDLCLKAGLLTGGVLCQVTAQNLDAYTSEGVPDEVCAIHNKQGQAHVLTLESITKLSQAKGVDGKVFIIENPLVFAAVRERLQDIKCTLVSPMGNRNLAFLRLLELLHAAGDALYYAGNMDFKGLIQADNLYLKFGKQFIPWRYSKDDYELTISTNNVLLSGERKDLAMHNEDLALILSQLRKRGKTASSVPLVPLLVEDVKRYIKHGGVQQ